MIKFDLPKGTSSIIKVIGVGGCGSNAVSYMYEKGIKGVNFIICNTDAQHIESKPVPNKIQLGPDLTEGLGVGADPEKGKQATIESLDEIKTILATNTKMVFITAGMGKGTGTGGAPVIAKAAKEMDILTVGIVTTPLAKEGIEKIQNAKNGIQEIKKYVDALLIISNDKVREIHGNLGISEAFTKANILLADAAKGIAEIVTIPEDVNVDINDVIKVIKDSGVAIMGSATAEGENRSLKCIEQALASPLLNDNNIKGAKNVLLNITSGSREITLDEIDEIMDYIQKETEVKIDNIIWGNCRNKELGEKISVTVIATGFEINEQNKITASQQDKKVMPLYDDDNSEKNGLPDKEVISDDEILDGQTVIEFDISQKLKQEEEPVVNNRKKDTASNTDNDDNVPPKKEPKSSPSHAKSADRNKERLAFLKNLSVKLKNSAYLSEIEKEPAFKRKNVQLEAPPHSSEENLSRFTLSEPEEDDDDDKPQIMPNNSFLHDNVD